MPKPVYYNGKLHPVLAMYINSYRETRLLVEFADGWHMSPDQRARIQRYFVPPESFTSTYWWIPCPSSYNLDDCEIL